MLNPDSFVTIVKYDKEFIIFINFKVQESFYIAWLLLMTGNIIICSKNALEKCEDASHKAGPS